MGEVVRDALDEEVDDDELLSRARLVRHGRQSTSEPSVGVLGIVLDQLGKLAYDVLPNPGEACRQRQRKAPSPDRWRSQWLSASKPNKGHGLARRGGGDRSSLPIVPGIPPKMVDVDGEIGTATVPALVARVAKMSNLRSPPTSRSSSWRLGEVDGVVV